MQMRMLKSGKNRWHILSVHVNFVFFSGVGMETFGSLGPEALKMLPVLGKLIGEDTDEPRAHGVLRQRLSVSLQRGTANVF